MLKVAASLDSHIASSLCTSRRGILVGARRSSRSMLRPGCIQLLAATLVLLVMTACGGKGSSSNPSQSPTITTQPANQTVTVGQTATFSVTATGTAPLAYQWSDNGTAIAGATSSTYTSAATAIGDNNSKFTVTVSNAAGSTNSNPATLTVMIGLPVITMQPTSVNVCTNASATLSVTANNSGTYQWSFNGSPIAGATSSTYFIASAIASDAGSYTVTVTNAAGSVTSQAATVQVGTSITSNPASLSIAQGQTAAFSVAAAGEAPFSYQWYVIAPSGSTGTAIAGATASTYTTPAELLGSSGSQYYVTVTDTCGSVLTSTSATLTVTAGNVPPTIVTSPASVTVAVGSTPTLTVTAVGPPTLTYQWYLIPAGSITGSAISGATSASYTVPATNTTVSNDQDGYYVIVSNSYGQATSQTAILSVGNGIQITKQPVSVYVSAGAPATFSVTATSTLTLTYQWFEAKPGSSTFTAISGATSATYTQASTASTDSGSVFHVVVTNGSTASVTSSSASVFVGALASVGNLCSGWTPLGSAQPPSSSCTIQLSTAGTNNQRAAIVWPNLISTGNVQLSFTFTTSDSTSPPADGFAMTLGDPSLGATTSSIGSIGSGLGAEGIPGVVLVFDDYHDVNDPPVPYIAVGRGESDLWETPYFIVNTNIPPLATAGATVSHNYVVSIVQGTITVTMDGLQLFSGSVTVPPVAYLYFSASTGNFNQQTVMSNFSATVTAPSN
jgi:Immunoglobulin domain/Immunoglobulin I-set domain